MRSHEVIPVRILHTSDWHLGRTLEGRSRLPEQNQFLEVLCGIAEDEAVDLVLVAGDVFDSGNPPAEAEELYYDALERLADGARRAVVVIAGNHDSPDRIHAANPLAVKHGISLVGYPGEELPAGGPIGGARRVAAGPGWFEVACPRCAETAVICTLAYPSESRLGELLTESLDDETQRAAYSEKVRRIVAASSTTFRPDTVGLVVGHLYTVGGRVSDSERQIQLGGAFSVEPGAFGDTASYVALGHLHRPQVVSGSPVPCRYSGSPLAYSFSEADQQKEVVIVDALPARTAAGRQPAVRAVPLTCGKPLRSWRASSLDEAFKWCADPRNLNSWVNLELECEQPPGTAETAALRKAHPGIINIIPVGTRAGTQSTGTPLSAMPLLDRFKLFCRRQTNSDPSPELIDLFLELAGEQDGPEAERP